MTEREKKMEALLMAAFASIEMRTENGRGFNLLVPLPWIETAHKTVYGEEKGMEIVEQRIYWARYRMENAG
jgi:hypothetical protein